jgi:hypothetical protein
MSNAPRPPSSIPLLAALAAGLAGCYSPEPDATTDRAAIDVGTCTRKPAVLFGPSESCGDDSVCPCGSFCDTEAGTCTYACMPPGTVVPNPRGTFPGDASACDAVGDVCDDDGRCMPVGGPPGTAVALGAEPPALSTIPGGASEQLRVQLDLVDPTPAEVTASERTVVNVAARDGAKVACDGVTFVDSCPLTSWSFAFTGQIVRAEKTVRVKTIADNPPGRGDVVLSIAVTSAERIVPTPARAPIATADGIYAGVASSAAYPSGIELRAIVRNNLVLLRDRSRTIAPDGALLVDLTTGPPAPRRKLVWLRGADSAATTTGLVGEYGAGAATVDLEAGSIRAPLAFDVPGTVGLASWNLELMRIEPHAAECTSSSSCASGEVCDEVLQACVPTAVLTPPTTPLGNAIDDKRSADWWTNVSPHLAQAVFATTGADLVESLVCTVDAGRRGRFGVAQVKQPYSDRSRSGDLECVDEAWPRVQPDAPRLNSAAGAVGLATLLDRESVEENRKTPQVLATCLNDLKRAPSLGAIFGGAFGVTVGKCANLARFVPAMRLLASDFLDRQTAADLDSRARGLLVRLTQQWAMLNGFLASAGATQRAADNTAIDPAPASAIRTRLLEVFDAVDRGWSALLDQRIAPAVTRAVGWSPSSLADQSRDYRLLKRPIAYWTFNTVASPLSRRHDLVRNAELVPNATATGVCAIGAEGTYFAQGFNCPGYTASLAAGTPSLVDEPTLGGVGKTDNLTITLNVDARDRGGPGTGGGSSLVGDTVSYCPQCPDPPEDEDPDPTPWPPPIPPPYRGGTLLATPTLAIAETVDPTTLVHSLVLVHPTATGVEWTTLSNTGELGPNVDGDPLAKPASVTVVRDTARKQYTVLITRGATTTEWSPTYTHDPVGKLDWVPAQSIRVGAAGTLPTGHYWAPYRKSYGGSIDDVAVFDAALSTAEVRAFAEARTSANLRTFWPADMTLQLAPAAEIEDIAVPLGAQLLEAQVAQLELAARVMLAMSDRASVACDPTATGAAAARAEVDAAMARAGRAVRQSHVVESMAAADTSTRAGEARVLLAAKRLALTRVLEPARCTPPFEMTENEIPLYHDSINPTWNETQAYFAGSDYFIGNGTANNPLGIAEAAARDASGALEAAREAYVGFRSSELQQAQEQLGREMRIEGLEAQYGDGLRRLCGIGGLTNHELVEWIHDPDPELPPFYVDTCFRDESADCAQQDSLSIADRNPACYRGQLGEQLMGMRASYLAFETAQQQWKTAIDNAKAARRFCIWKEVDLNDCSVLDRYELSGVECPPNHLGTRDLVLQFNRSMSDLVRSRGTWSTVLGGIAGIMTAHAQTRAPQVSAPVFAFPIGILVAAAVVKGVGDFLTAQKDATIDARRRNHQEELRLRSEEAEIVECWSQAEQYERSIQAAEDASIEAFARFSASAIGFDNARREADHIVLEAPAAMDRENSRPSIPFSFHYWLDERISTYERLFERAKRYTYIGLRATEYDLQRTYKTVQTGKPERGAVLAATHPQQLLDQLALMRQETGTRKVNGRSPALKWTTMDLGERLWGLPVSSPLVGLYLSAYLRSVYSVEGEYMGRGLRFTLVPRDRHDPPAQRCAERIWRVAVGSARIPTDNSGDMIAKVLKRNVFASRKCKGDGRELQTAIWRPATNLLVGGGDSSTYEDPVTETPADVPLVRLDVGDALDHFRNSATPPPESSSELALQGLYGDYILLFPPNALAGGLAPHTLYDLNIRFDQISVDDTPQSGGLMDLDAAGARDGAEPEPEPFEVQLDTDTGPIVVD